MIIPTLILSAIAMVESNDNCNAVGRNGELGHLQITPICVEDVNRILGRQAYTLEDRRDRTKSVEMFHIYVNHYATERRLGRPVTLEDVVRIWNGGPHGWKRWATIPYRDRVLSEVQRVAVAAGQPMRSTDVWARMTLEPGLSA